MNINQYMCNMKVLVNLFLANATSLVVYKPYISRSSKDYEYDINYCDYSYFSPQIKIISFIKKNQHIEVAISRPKSPETIYEQNIKRYVSHTSVELEVFLL